jgi:hypothetical protein
MVTPHLARQQHSPWRSDDPFAPLLLTILAAVKGGDQDRAGTVIARMIELMDQLPRDPQGSNEAMYAALGMLRSAR